MDTAAAATRSPIPLSVPTREDLLESILAFIERHSDGEPRMTRTRFGIDACGEGNFIKTLEEGRSPSLDKTQKIVAFMAERDIAAGFAASPTKSRENIRSVTEQPGEAPEVAQRPFPAAEAASPAASTLPSSSISSRTPARPPSPADSQGCSTAGEAEAA